MSEIAQDQGRLLPRQLSGHNRVPAKYATLTLLAGIVLSVTAWWFTLQDTDQAARQRMEGIADKATNVLQRRMVGHEQILRGGSALFSSHGGWVTREQWRNYVGGLRLSENYPGIQGLGFAYRVPAATLPRHLTQIRREGFPEYSVKPDTPRTEYHPIIYLEPFTGRNLRAFGYDMMTESTRREAMTRARDSGDAALSGRVKLVQETNKDVQPGFLLYLPVYRQCAAIATMDERRNALLCYEYSQYRSRHLLSSSCAETSGETVIDCISGRSASVDETLFSNSDPERNSKALYHLTRHIKLAGTEWTINFHSTPTFEGSARSTLPVFILGAGIVVSLLAAYVIMILSHASPDPSTDHPLEQVSGPRHQGLASEVPTRPGNSTEFNPAQQRGDASKRPSRRVRTSDYEARNAAE